MSLWLLSRVLQNNVFAGAGRAGYLAEATVVSLLAKDKSYITLRLNIAYAAIRTWWPLSPVAIQTSEQFPDSHP
ncbi:hypothetical protein KCP78_02710 [Salmonella enterica subsp. enterica]|nr:hypothetical protein KCP78_02710 [Salmonella enterica subsp. enterica]